MPPIIYTNHKIVVKISRQELLFTLFIDKFNFCLIRILEYILRFNLIIKHKSKKKHIMSNFLSNLKFSKPNFDFERKKLNALTIFISEKQSFVFENQTFNFSSTIEVFSKFRKQIIQKYQNQTIWIKIQDMISKTQKNSIKIFFCEKNKLIYFNENHILSHVQRSKRLCLFYSVLKSIFQAAHEHSLLRFYRCCEILFLTYYIRNFTTNLKTYLKYCSKCQINQI